MMHGGGFYGYGRALHLRDYSGISGEWFWPAAEPDDRPVEFFQYSVHIGRLIHLRQQGTIPTRLRAWLHGGLSHAFLSRFWTCIWSLRVSRRVSQFLHVDSCVTLVLL